LEGRFAGRLSATANTLPPPLSHTQKVFAVQASQLSMPLKIAGPPFGFFQFTKQVYMGTARKKIVCEKNRDYYAARYGEATQTWTGVGTKLAMDGNRCPAGDEPGRTQWAEGRGSQMGGTGQIPRRALGEASSIWLPANLAAF